MKDESWWDTHLCKHGNRPIFAKEREDGTWVPMCAVCLNEMAEAIAEVHRIDEEKPCGGCRASCPKGVEVMEVMCGMHLAPVNSEEEDEGE